MSTELVEWVKSHPEAMTTPLGAALGILAVNRLAQSPKMHHYALGGGVGGTVGYAAGRALGEARKAPPSVEDALDIAARYHKGELSRADLAQLWHQHNPDQSALDQVQFSGQGSRIPILGSMANYLRASEAHSRDALAQVDSFITTLEQAKAARPGEYNYDAALDSLRRAREELDFVRDARENPVRTAVSAFTPSGSGRLWRTAEMALSPVNRPISQGGYLDSLKAAAFLPGTAIHGYLTGRKINREVDRQQADQMTEANQDAAPRDMFRN